MTSLVEAVAARLRSRDDAEPSEEVPLDSLGALCRLVFDFRLLALLITAIYIPFRGGDSLALVAAWSFAAVASLIGLRRWNSVGPLLTRHPSLLALDLLVALALLTVIGVTSPFFYFTLGTALLAGALYGWTGAAIFSGLLLAGYWSAFSIQSTVIEGLRSFDAMVGNPALYPIAAGGGAALRDLLIKKHTAEVAAEAVARSSAVERERSRIAREMHDSLAKTLHGMALSAAALEQWIERDPARARVQARDLAAAARDAAAEAREIIRDLRADVLSVPLRKTLEAHVREWSSRTGIDAVVRIEMLEEASPGLRWETFRILREALDNVDRHASAKRVEVMARQEAGELVLEVRDDGRGFEVPSRLSDLAADGHFGIVGIDERAQSIGGRLELRSGSEGTVLRVRVPLTFEAPARTRRRA